MNLHNYAMRPATRNDLAQLHEIYTHPSVSPYLGFEPCPLEEFGEIFNEHLEGGLMVVREGDGRIEAVCQIVPRSRRRRHVVYVGSLAIHHQDQGHGVGRRFFSDILALLHQEGFTRIELQTAADNHKAVAFFKSFGFEIEGTLRDYFTRADQPGLFNALLMAKL